MTANGVLVAGAGPAGSATALLLARAGIDVRIVERAQFPRRKVCGEYLNSGAVEALGRLGVLDAVTRGRRAAARRAPGRVRRGAGYLGIFAAGMLVRARRARRAAARRRRRGRGTRRASAASTR